MTSHTLFLAQLQYKPTKEVLATLFFFKVRVDPKDMSLDELWAIWEKGAEAAIGAKEAGSERVGQKAMSL